MPKSVSYFKWWLHVGQVVDQQAYPHMATIMGLTPRPTATTMNHQVQGPSIRRHRLQGWRMTGVHVKGLLIALRTIYKEIYLQNQPAQFNQLEGSDSKMFTCRLNSIEIMVLIREES